MPTIHKLSAATAPPYLPALIELLQDSVHSGGSVGFLSPLSEAEAGAYWHSAFAAIADGSRVLLIAVDEHARVVGTAQLDLCQKGNGLHRAEVMKVLTHTSARRRGIGRALMLALETEARAVHRTTLVLDTLEGDAGERLYQALGWQVAGRIPQYARHDNGELLATVVYYKLL